MQEQMITKPRQSLPVKDYLQEIKGKRVY